jgi:hypothetical protein
MSFAYDALPVGTKVRIKPVFTRNGDTSVTVAPDFDGVIVELGHLEDSYTGLQSYVVELVGPIPPEVGKRRWWADETQFNVVEES